MPCIAAASFFSALSPALAGKLAVVELFQSQGCSSCPPANANVMALSDRPELLTLSFGVTYWDQLGWKDTFAKKQYTDRQWDYARAFRRAEVFTPEVVVNGRADVTGIDRGELESLIRREAGTDGSVAVSIAGGAVRLGSGIRKETASDVWLVRYDPNIEQVAVARGENEGRTLPHRNVVKELVKIGSWNGEAESVPIPRATHAGLREAVIVQDGPGGPILAAARG